MTKGERIRLIRERLGKTQTAFADAIGVSKQTLFKYENNIITNVPSDKIELMAEVANVSPAFIMGWEPEEIGNIVFMTPTTDEQNVIMAYRRLSEEGKSVIRRALGIEK